MKYEVIWANFDSLDRLHLKILTDNSGINGFAVASAFHNNLLTINEIKKFLIDYNINIKD